MKTLTAIKLQAVVILLAVFVLPFISYAQINPTSITSLDTILTITNAEQPIEWLLYDSNGNFYSSLNNGDSGQTWNDLDGDLSSRSYNVILANTFDAECYSLSYQDCKNSVFYLDEEFILCIGDCGILSNSQIATILATGFTDTGTILLLVLGTILIALIALIGLGYGIRDLKDHVIGKKF